MQETVLVLDAMGVIYAAADDVEELLVPFVREREGLADDTAIARYYTQASLGEMDAATFWRAVGLSPHVEDEYLSRHRLNEGLLPLLDDLPSCISSVWCLSNDVAEWSRKLRSLHDLEERFDGFVISGDVGVRKPNRGIYERLIEAVGHPAKTLLFVDDRQKNLDAARALGIRTIQFGPATNAADEPTSTRIPSFDKLYDFCRSGL